MNKLLLAGLAAIFLTSISPAQAAIVEYRDTVTGDTVPASATNRLPVDASRLTPLGDVQMTSLGSAVGLTLPTGASACSVQAETQNVRYRVDGTNPTSSVGTIIYAGSPPTVFVGTTMLAAVKFIETTSSAKLNVSCYK